MSRDLMDESYYVSHGGMIPVKWTAPEVCIKLKVTSIKVETIVYDIAGSPLQEVLHC